jgi:predicted aminopeptidase
VSGCSLLALGAGQLSLINEQRPLKAAIAREADPERRRLLQEVPEIVAFAEEVVGLRAGRSYSGYFETEREGLTFVVTACRRTRFEPYTWWFPIVGTVEYRSYWDEVDARAVADALEAQGYDTWISPSRAYSSLGILRDPIATTMLRDGLTGLTEVVIHELSHARLFIPGHTEWNEALASFVGERGAERYFEQERWKHTPLREQMRARAERREQLDRAVTESYVALEELYGRALPEPELLTRRAAAFAALRARMQAILPADRPRDLRLNNARLLHLHRYGAGNAELSRLWQASGSNFRRFWALAEDYARTQL